MIKPVRWKSGTCLCIIIYNWNTELKEPEPSYVLTKIQRHCQAHQHLGGQKLLLKILEESKLRQYTFALAKTIKPDLEEVHYSWYFDDKRILHAAFDGFTAEMNQTLRSDLRYWLNLEGTEWWDMTGKVIIE